MVNDPAVLRLLEAVLLLVLFEHLLGTIALRPDAKKLVDVILIILAVVWVFFGKFLLG